MAPDRCPNCAGPLRFPDARLDGLCPSCGIYVEILKPLPEKREAVEDGVGSVDERRNLARLYLELEDVLGEFGGEAEVPPPPEAAAEPQGREEAIPQPPEPEAVGGLALAPEAAPPEEVAPADVAPPPPEPSLDETVEVPPEPGSYEDETLPEPPAPEITFVEPIPMAPPPPPMMAATARSPPARPKRRRWDRALFYVGTATVALGASGLVLGSIIHDILRVPMFGTAFDAFGPLNLSAAVLGAIVAMAGMAAMALAARVGSVRRPRAAGA